MMTWNLYYFWKAHFKLKFPLMNVGVSLGFDSWVQGPINDGLLVNEKAIIGEEWRLTKPEERCGGYSFECIV